MAIKPTQHGIKVLFEQNHTFQVPKYQRGYAWDDQAVADFLADMTRCLKGREADKPLNHFFGGIVAAKWPIADSGRSNFEVIDGQQRLCTFVLLIARLARKMVDVAQALDDKAGATSDEKVAAGFLKETLVQLRALYLTYRDNVGMKYVEVRKLSLSEADDDFFQALIDGEQAEAERASHARLQTAWKLIGDFVDGVIFAGGDATAGAERVRLLVNEVLEFDCSVIFMATDTRSEAYQIFQVLNDRGVLLTDGDLLRARTMELLDQPELLGTQDKVAKRWDEVLAYSPGEIDSYLRWYFSSHEGKRPSSSALADEFMTARFKVTDGVQIDVTRAQAMLAEVKAMATAFSQLETMGEGDWPLKTNPKVVSWDRERLRMLVVHLKHTNAMPLLLSLQLLSAERFAEAVATLERFVFRYKTIGNAHVSPMTELYLKHAKGIRASAAGYKVSSLRTDLKALIDKNVPEDLFRANLRQTRYRQRAGNGHIRYMLIAIEDHIDWLKGAAAGVPKCKDKSVVFDFSNTTLEHVYPRSAKGTDKVSSMETVKDTLGNLTIFGPEDNDALANKNYAEKRAALKASKLRMNRDIGANAAWDATRVRARSATLVDMAAKLFVP